MERNKMMDAIDFRRLKIMAESFLDGNYSISFEAPHDPSLMGKSEDANPFYRKAKYKISSKMYEMSFEEIARTMLFFLEERQADKYRSLYLKLIYF